MNTLYELPYESNKEASTLYRRQFFSGLNYESSGQRATWIAPFAMLIIWMASILILNLMGGGRRRPSHSMAEARAMEGRPMTNMPTVDASEKQVELGDRFRRVVSAARLNFILLFSGTVITALGFGATAGNIALTWIAFAVGAMWVLLEAFFDSHWLRLVVSIIIFPLVIINWGLAFRSRIKRGLV